LAEDIAARTRSVRLAADDLFDLIRQGHAGKQKAACLIDQTLGNWMDQFFIRNGVPLHEAEELTMDVWLKVFSAEYEVQSNGYALLCRMRHSRLVDYIKHRHAARSRNSANEMAEIIVDDEQWDVLVESVADTPATPDWVRDCMSRQAAAFERAAPQRSALLEMVVEGLQYKEIAAVLFQVEEEAVDKQMVARVRNRIEEARKQAAGFFEKCRE
jgi:DNA-directed RNA polymerase specialized sigma24 family protein